MTTDARSIILDHIARKFGEKMTLTVDELMASLHADKHGYDRPFVISVLKGLDKGGLGWFRTGRRGHPSRIHWKQKPAETVSTVDSGPNFVQPTARTAGDGMLRFTVPLRPGTAAEISLPEDVTSAEASKIVSIVERLARE